MLEKLTDRDFVIYSEQYCSLKGQIRDRQLYLESYVYGDDYDSEQHIEFTAEDTEKLFSLMSFEEFVGFLHEKRLYGFNEFLREKGIEPQTITI